MTDTRPESRVAEPSATQHILEGMTDTEDEFTPAIAFYSGLYD